MYENVRSQVDKQKNLLSEREKELENHQENNSRNAENIKGLRAELAARGQIVITVLLLISIILILCSLVSKLMIFYR